MKKLVYFFILFIGSMASLQAQVWPVLEDGLAIVCDTDLNAGASADTIYICQNSTQGFTVINGLCAEYSPNPNYFGYDSVCLTTCIAGVCTDSVIHFTISPVGDRIFQSTPEDASFFVCENVISGGSNVVISGCSPPLYGTDNYNPSCVIYAPPTNYVGLDSFCIVSCIDTLCDTSILVMNMTPVTESISVSVPGNGSVVICSPELQTIMDTITNIGLTCGPTAGTGTVVVNAVTNCVEYTPDASFDGTGLTGTDQICISICNSQGVCDITNVNVTITGFDVTNVTDATLLAESLAGGGVDITNAVLNCPGVASGSFSNPPNLLGLEDGVVLTNGIATDVSQGSAFAASTDDGALGDPDLTALIAASGLESLDACVLEFDIQVLGDSLTFNYVFGSEEYTNFTCSNYNDVFGFFITGQNPVGANYANQNIALIPGTTTPVTINTVNDGVNDSPGGITPCTLTNTQFYNGVIPSIAYDGNTIPLQAKVPTVPCTSYHFKLGVGDGSPVGLGDRILDSGVFLEAGSFTSLPVTLASSTILGNGFVNAVEECVDGQFAFELDKPLAVDYGIKFLIGGTATNGVDYATIQDSITFFAGDTIVNVPISPLSDALAEGTESVVLYLLNNCTGQPFDSATLNIIDLIPYNLTVSEDTICQGDTAILHATIAGDNDNLATYSWTPNNGSVLDIDSGYTGVIPMTTTEYQVEYTLGTCTLSDTTVIEVPIFSRVIDTTLISCPGANDGGFVVTPNGGVAPYTYDWSPLGVTDSFVNNLGPDTLVLTTSDNSGLTCGTFIDTLILTEPSGLSFTFDTTNVSCNGLDDGAVTVSNLTPSTNYDVIVMYNGASFPSQSITTDPVGEFTLGNLPPGAYDSITITNPASGCGNSFSFNITEPDSLAATIVTPGVVLCAGGAIDSLGVQVTGGTTPYSYLWSTTEMTEIITGVTVGTYWVQVTDTNACQTTDTFIVSQPSPLVFTLLSDSVSCFGGNDGLAYVDTISGGTAPYTYLWDAAAANQTNDTAQNLAAGMYVLTVTDFNGCPKQDSILVEEYSDVLISESHLNVACFGDSSASIDITMSGGNTPYSYSWIGPNGFTSINEDISSLTVGTYTLTVTDSKMCSEDTSIIITEPLALSLAMDSTNVTCKDLANGTATVVGSGGTPAYTYLWNDALAQTTATANNLDVGSYQVILTDANGCQDSASINITEPDSLLLSLDSLTNVLCNGASTGAISLSTAGGTPTYSYSWTNGGGTAEDLGNAAAGTYTLTVTDANNCQTTLTETLTEPTALSIALVPTNISCFGGTDGEIDATVTGGVTPYTYSWTGPNGFADNVEDITGLAAGTYTLAITDSNNCTLSQNVTISQPADVQIGFTTTAVNCFGGNDGTLTASVVTGGTAPFQYQWNGNANNQSTATANGLTAGTYSVEVTDGNGCMYTDSSTVTEPAAPLSIVLDSVDISCAGYNNGNTSVAASGGTPGYSYLWNDPLAQTTATAIDLAPGIYQVTVTDANECTEVGNISISEPDPITVQPIVDSTNCFGDASGAISVIAGGGTTIGYAYSIDGGATFQNSPDFYNLPAGVYNEIIVQDLGSTEDCFSALYSTTIFEQPFFSFNVVPEDTTLQLEESLTLDLVVTSPSYSNADIAQVAWYPTTGLNCSDCVDPTVLTYEHYTEYTATVYYYGDDDELCNATSNTVIMVENNLLLYIPNAFTPGGFDNVNNVFEVYGEGIEFITMQVYNRWGEKIFESANQQVAWDGTFKGEMQNPGVYTYYVAVEYLDGKTIERKGSVTLIR